MAQGKRANGHQSQPVRKRVKLADEPKQAKTPAPAAKSSQTAAVQPADAANAAPSSHFDRFELVAGSYERLLYGFQASFNGAGELGMAPIFSFPAHLSCIKTCAASPGGSGSSNARHWLVTSSTDDTVKLWDLARRKEVGLLVGHEAPATHMQFLGAGNKQLLTCSEDGTLKLFRTKDWALIRNFKGHKARVNSVDVHPAGRIALSVSADRTVRFWDLLGSKESAAGGGKQGSSSTKLGAEGDLVRWNTKGTRFAIICGREIRLFSVNMQVLATMTSRSRFHDIKFVQLPQFGDRECMLVACEDGKARIYPLDPEDSPDLKVVCAAELVGHTNRIKELHHLPVSKPDGTLAQLVTTASSNGTIHIYDLSVLSPSQNTGEDQEPQAVEPLLRHDTKGSRLTCLTVTGYMPGRAPSDIAKQAPVQEESESEDSEASSDSDEDDDDDDDEEEELELELDGEDLSADDDEEELEEEEEEADGEEWGGIGA